QITGRCTVCHDPHGVLPSKTDAAYMVPALKGTWMTSPYKEDRAPAGPTSLRPTANTYEWQWQSRRNFGAPRFNPRFDYNKPPLVGAGYGTGYGASNWAAPGGTGGYGYFIDDNTFGTSVTFATSGTAITDQNMRSGWYPSTATVTANYMTETETQFAGLCSTCHFANAGAKTALIDVTSNNGTTTVEAHKAVKGWGAAGTTTTSDIFKNTDSANHLMVWYTTSTSTNSMQCTVTSSDTSRVLPSGYRWSVNPGTEVQRSTSSATMSLNPPGSGGQQTAGFVQSNFHNFPCSKCHTAHTSKLPRLMKTNCLDVGTSTVNPGHANGGTGEGTLAYPNCATGTGATQTNRLYTMTCHNTRKANTASGGGWNTITGW
ncbi:MAG TPA: hypothetical protein VGB23_03395, partial [Nitrospirota bacterium]